MDHADGLDGVEALFRGGGCVDRFGDSRREVAREVVDDGAETPVEFDFGVEHVFHDFGQEATAHDAPQVPRVEEAAPFAELPECVCDAGEIEGDVRRDVLYVEGYYLLLEDQ